MNYNQVVLIPRFGICESRSDADVSVSCNFANRTWKMPVVPSNMAASIDFKLARWMSDNDYFYILHRFYPYEDIYEWVKNNQDAYISLSVRVKEKDKALIAKLANNGLRVDCLTVDIAHGYSAMMQTMCKYIDGVYRQSERPFLILGNIFGDSASVRFLQDCGADAVKVGLAFGKACSTYNQTGFASPMFSSGLTAANYARVPIIGDGGIREDGDLAKGLVAGYDMVMAGSVFARCVDSPAPLNKERTKKIYFGSASAKNKADSGQEVKYVEGKSIELELDERTVEKRLLDMEYALRSAVSYAGGKDLEAFKYVRYEKI